ncbi:MAG: ATP-binding protein [Anaerolineae bacterium]
MMVGLPGTGKSSIVRSLNVYFPAVVVGTDNIRAKMRRQPSYTAAEMGLIYEICYAIIEKRLCLGQRVVFDASNYLESRRKYVANLAQSCGAPVATCYVQASQETIGQRLAQRISGKRQTGDLSDADWTVYKWMVEAQEPIVGEHLILDTTTTPAEELAKRLYNYWSKIEADAESNLDLQPPSWASQFDRADSPSR